MNKSGKNTVCAHGGAFWNAIGSHFQTLDRRVDVVNADVLDAWFPPAPGVALLLSEHLPWLLQTSPPQEAEGLRAAISAARGVPEESLVLGAGSSALMFLALRHWLTPESRVLLPGPTYGEYGHLLERVIGCRVDHISLDAESIQAHLTTGNYDLLVLVNPNNPTGDTFSQSVLTALLANAPRQTRVWVDEAYTDYLGPGASLETIAAGSENSVVCKSLSKGLALSGARVAYLCGPPILIQEMRGLTPPWAISLPAQVAAVAALADPAYYATRYAETHALREQLAASLGQTVPDWSITASPANWLLCHLPNNGPDAATLCRHCALRGVFLRAFPAQTYGLSPHALRISVKDAAQNIRIVETLKEAHRA